MRKYLAALLLVIMTVSVVSAAGVVTTQKAAAVQVIHREGVPYTLPVTGTMKWDGGLCNYHVKAFSSRSGTPAYHAEQSNSNVAKVYVISNKYRGKLDGYAVASVGIPYKLSFSNWNAVKDRPVTVYISYTYDLNAKPSAALPSAFKSQVGATSYVKGPSRVMSVAAINSGHKYAVVQTVPSTMHVHDLAPNSARGDYTGVISVGVTSYVGLPAVNAVPATAQGIQSVQASARFISVTITFH